MPVALDNHVDVPTLPDGAVDLGGGGFLYVEPWSGSWSIPADAGQLEDGQGQVWLGAAIDGGFRLWDVRQAQTWEYDDGDATALEAIDLTGDGHREHWIEVAQSGTTRPAMHHGVNGDSSRERLLWDVAGARLLAAVPVAWAGWTSEAPLCDEWCGEGVEAPPAAEEVGFDCADCTGTQESGAVGDARFDGNILVIGAMVDAGGTPADHSDACPPGRYRFVGEGWISDE